MIGRRTHCLLTLAATRLLIGSLILAMMQATALAYQDPPNAPDQQSTNRSSVDGRKQPISNSLTLELDKPIQREIALYETHSYRVVLVAGQYLNVIVDQREADVEIRCIGPDGKRIGFLKRRIKTPVPTPVSLIAATSGEHRVELTYVKVRLSTNKGSKVYEIKISELRPSTPYDVSRLSTRSSSWIEANNLLREQTPESRQKAFEKFEELLRRLRVFGDRRAEVLELDGLAAMFSSSEPQKALYFGNQALALYRDLGEVRSQISMLIVCGINYGVLGELDKELSYYTEALSLSRAMGDRDTELRSLNYLKNFYSGVGDKQKVAEINIETEPLNSALAEEEKAALQVERAAALQKTLQASELVKQGTPQSRQTAIEHYEDALRLFRTAGDREGEVETLISLGRVTALLGGKKKAVDFIEQAMLLVKANKTLYELRTSTLLFYSVAEAYVVLGEKLKAIDVYTFMIEIFRLSKFTSAEADLHSSISRLYESLDDKVRALEHLNRALQLLQSLLPYDESDLARMRRRIAKIESDRGNLRESLAQIEAALEIIEQRRSKIVSQYIRSSYFASSQSYYEFYIDLLMRLNKVHESEGYAIRALQASESARARSLIEVLSEANASIHTRIDPVLLERRKKLKEQLNAKAANSSGLNQTQDRRVESNHEIWELTTAYHQVEAQIRQRNPQYSALTQPGRLTLSQIQKLLDSDTVLLEYSLGTERSYLWLVTPTSFASYENVSRRPATRDDLTELQRSVRDVLAADKSGNAKTVIPRLPFSREEANAIFSIAPRGEAIRAVDFEANRANAANQTVAQARVVHFASHGLLNSEHPELSGIVLSLVNKDGEPIDGFLRLHEIYNLNLSADLVVLSACQTALGKEIRGEGLVGLTRGFMYAGAPRVIASLWKVDDVSTAELMKIFYRKMLRERKSPSAALREAQLQMWRSKRWHQPYYWAAFQLQGDWK